MCFVYASRHSVEEALKVVVVNRGEAFVINFSLIPRISDKEDDEHQHTQLEHVHFDGEVVFLIGIGNLWGVEGIGADVS